MSRLRTALAAGVSALALGAGLFAGLAPNASIASSHREAPLVAADPQVDRHGPLRVPFTRPGRATCRSSVPGSPSRNRRAGRTSTCGPSTRTTTSTSTTTGTLARTSSTGRRSTRGTGTRTRSCTTPGRSRPSNDPDLNINQTYDLYRIDVGRHRSRKLFEQREGRAEQRRRRVDAQLPGDSSTPASTRTWVPTRGSDSPMTRSSSTSACSICSTGATCRRPATTRSTGSTSTRSHSGAA